MVIKTTPKECEAVKFRPVGVVLFYQTYILKIYH